MSMVWYSKTAGRDSGGISPNSGGL